MVEFAKVLFADDASAVLRLVDEASAADRVAPLSEQALLQLERPRHGVRHALVREPNGALAGYAGVVLPDAADEAVGAELFVAPQQRGHGLGRLLLSAVQDEASGRDLHVWAHGDHPAAARLAARLHYERQRVLLQLRRGLGEPLEEPHWPAGVSVRTFTPGRDEAAWLAVNNAAFATHPEQGKWTLDDLAQREAKDWFDPSGFFLAERDGQLLGFHWTKVHRSGGSEDPPIGEVYVVGVLPQEAGHGLGPALTLAGLQHLQAAGLDRVLLYVDESNVPAVKTYTRLGFTRYAADVLYARSAKQPR